MDVYEVVTKEILERIDQGVIPWQITWSRRHADRNGVSNREYRGINTILTSMKGFAQTDWYTMRQIRDGGWRLKEGRQRMTTVCFFKKYIPSKTQEDAILEVLGVPNKSGARLTLRYYGVFNREQIDGLPELPPDDDVEFNPIEECEKVIEEFADRPQIRYGGGQPYYSPSQDYVQMPPKGDFDSPEEFYAALFHELVHSTGHASRTGRTEGQRHKFGSTDYAREELTAEIGAAMLCRHCGITKTFENAVAYLQSWRAVLCNDKKCVVIAAQRAQKAVDYMLNLKQDEKGNLEEE